MIECFPITREEVVRLALPLLSVAVPMLVLPSVNETVPLGVPVPLAAATVAVRVTGPPRAGVPDERLSDVVVDAGVEVVVVVPGDAGPLQPRISIGKQAALRTARVTNCLRRLRSPNSSNAAAATNGASREARSAVDELTVPLVRGEVSWMVNGEENTPLLSVTGPKEHASPVGRVDGHARLSEAGTAAPETGVTVTVADPLLDVEEIVKVAGLIVTVNAGVVVITALTAAPDE